MQPELLSIAATNVSSDAHDETPTQKKAWSAPNMMAFPLGGAEGGNGAPADGGALS